jgi:hypothetical protein
MQRKATARNNKPIHGIYQVSELIYLTLQFSIYITYYIYYLV